jgi:hypothetical protein
MVISDISKEVGIEKLTRRKLNYVFMFIARIRKYHNIKTANKYFKKMATFTIFEENMWT